MAISESTAGGEISGVGIWQTFVERNTETGATTARVIVNGVTVIPEGTPIDVASNALRAQINSPGNTPELKQLYARAVQSLSRQNAELARAQTAQQIGDQTSEPLPGANVPSNAIANGVVAGQSLTSDNKNEDDRRSSGAPSTVGLATGTITPPSGGTSPSLGSGTVPSSVSAAQLTQADGADDPTVSDWSKSKDKLELDPGKINPLSQLSTYTYSIVLYMVTPEKMNDFIAAGGVLRGIKTAGSGVYTIAQSGGINNSTDERLITLSRTLGLGEEGYDYYIDDLTMTTFLPGGENRATVGTELKFKIYEPYSFNLLTDIARASQNVNSTSSIASNPKVQLNGFQQHYILGIKFYGYDLNGNVATADSPEFKKNYNNGDAGDQNAVVQRFFAVKFTNIKFKLDGKMTVYQCETVVVSEQEAYNRTNGSVRAQLNLTGGTVGDALTGGSPGARGLAQVLTEMNAKARDAGQTQNAGTITIEFLDDSNQVVPPSQSEIGRSLLLDDAAFAAATAPLSSAKSTDQVTVANTFKATTIDTNSRTIGVTSGSPITTIIDNIIVKSRWITDALTKTGTDDAESKTVDVTSKRNLRWYTINPVVKATGLDDRTNNWTYDITYQIKPYNIPYLRTQIADRSKYPGPYKFYNYLFTGRNTEIISYEQQFDNLYYTIASASTNPSERSGSPGSAPVAIQNTPGISDPRGGKNNTGSRLNDEVRAQLYSPGDQAEAKIRIIGDPDYIMTTVGVNITTASKFYGNDSSISPLNGQVFIQVVFNMAVDYDTVNGKPVSNGLMEITDKIQFYQTDRVRKSGIKGMVYMVVQVDSQFSRGQFVQTLHCLMVDESQLVTPEAESSPPAAVGSQGHHLLPLPLQPQRQHSRPGPHSRPPHRPQVHRQAHPLVSEPPACPQIPALPRHPHR